MKIEIWHNIMWSNYKAAVYSELWKICQAENIELRIYQIAESDRQRVSLTNVDYEQHQYPFINLFKGPYDDIPILRLITRIALISFKSDADIVLVAGYHRLEYIIQGIILMLRRKKRAVFCDSTAYDNPVVWYKTLIKRISFRIFGNVFCYGLRASDYVVGLGVARDRAFQRCQAASLPPGYSEERVIERRRSPSRLASAPTFLYVGRLAAEKRLDTLVEAFGSVLAKFPQTRLRLVGSGPLLGDLTQMVRDLGMDGSVDFTGPKAKAALEDEFINAHALVLPSWSEPWGLVVNEALHFGCPVIVSQRCGCLPELVEDSPVGQVFEAGNAADLASKMEKSLEIWKDSGEVAFSCLRVIAPYSPQNAAKNIFKGLKKILINP